MVHMIESVTTQRLPRNHRADDVGVVRHSMALLRADLHAAVATPSTAPAPGEGLHGVAGFSRAVLVELHQIVRADVHASGLI